ncbi:MFS transporter [Amycolatopsis sp. NPDC026612]|uniref:MFS transporter n=1 Tax=Amycolatopsis sp. NPDC026612 TaxID=3155466 RepID=UPI0033D57D5D
MSALRTDEAKYRYRDIVSSRGWPAWAVATIGSRLPVAMAPLALVLVGHEASGGYAFGGLLVVAHTLGEACAAPVAGTLVDKWSPRRMLAPCLAVEALLFVALAVSVTADAPPAVLLATAALAGAIPAGAPGGLRSTLTHVVGPAALPRALSLDTVLNQACWGLAPILASVTATLFSPTMTIALVAAIPAMGTVAALWLPRTPPHREDVARTALWPLARLLGRSLLLTAVLRLLLGAMTVVAPPLFESALSGVALGAYAIGTGLGSLLYSARRTWPGSHEQQADVCLALLGAVVVSCFFFQGSTFLLCLYGLAGLLEGPVVLARSLHLERILPADRRATGFSLQYAAIGWGFAAGGLVLAETITTTPPHIVLAATGAAAAAIALLAFLLPSRIARRS